MSNNGVFSVFDINKLKIVYEQFSGGNVIIPVTALFHRNYETMKNCRNGIANFTLKCQKFQVLRPRTFTNLAFGSSRCLTTLGPRLAPCFMPDMLMQLFQCLESSAPDHRLAIQTKI